MTIQVRPSEDSEAGRIAGDGETGLGKLEGPLEPTLVGFMHVGVARQLQLEAAMDRDVDGAIQRIGDRLRTEFMSASTKLDAARLLRRTEVAYEGWRKGRKHS